VKIVCTSVKSLVHRLSRTKQQQKKTKEKVTQLVTHTGIRTSLSLFMLHFQWFTVS